MKNPLSRSFQTRAHSRLFIAVSTAALICLPSLLHPKPVLADSTVGVAPTLDINTGAPATPFNEITATTSATFGTINTTSTIATLGTINTTSTIATLGTIGTIDMPSTLGTLNTTSTIGTSGTINTSGFFGAASSTFTEGGVYVTVVPINNVSPQLQINSVSGFFPTLNAPASGSQLLLSSSLLNQHGAHSRPLMRRVPVGQNTFWVSGDLGRDDHGSRDGDIGLAEIGTGHNFGFLQMNLSIGKTGSEQHYAYNGNTKGETTFILAESLIPVSRQLWMTIGGYGSRGDLKTHRNYLLGTTVESSYGNPDVNLWGMRARLDIENAIRLSTVDMAPYVDFSYSNIHVDSFSEAGGILPVTFDKYHQSSTDLRLGCNASLPVSSNWSLVGTLEGTHRFETRAANSISTDMNNGFQFIAEGTAYKQNWLRAALALDGKVLKNDKLDCTTSLTFNITTEGEAPNIWVAANFQVAFK